jgi:hypothetical protein
MKLQEKQAPKKCVKIEVLLEQKISNRTQTHMRTGMIWSALVGDGGGVKHTCTLLHLAGSPFDSRLSGDRK